MEKKDLFPLYVAKLSLADLYSLSKSTIDYALPVKDSMSDLLKATFTQLEADNKAMFAALHKPEKSGYTPMLRIKGVDRKDCFNEIKRNVQTDRKSSDTVKKLAGEALKLFMDPYWDTDKEAMNTATAIFDEMLAKYKADATLVAHAATVDITSLINKLETINTEFASLYQTRDTENAAHESPSASSLKPAQVKGYEEFCAALEMAVNYVPTDSLLALFAQIDELRKKYARLVSKDDDDDTPEEPTAE